MQGFIVGCREGDDEGISRLLDFLDETDGFQYLQLDPVRYVGVAWFETEEQAHTAQWMMMMSGAKTIEGGEADGEMVQRSESIGDHGMEQ